MTDTCSAFLHVCGRMCSLQQTYEAKRQEFLVELQKREDEMRQMFVQRVKEKEAELKDAEREVWRHERKMPANQFSHIDMILLVMNQSNHILMYNTCKFIINCLFIF